MKMNIEDTLSRILSGVISIILSAVKVVQDVLVSKSIINSLMTENSSTINRVVIY
jgi:hypothetical protein